MVILYSRSIFRITVVLYFKLFYVLVSWRANDHAKAPGRKDENHFCNFRHDNCYKNYLLKNKYRSLYQKNKYFCEIIQQGSRFIHSVFLIGLKGKNNRK